MRGTRTKSAISRDGRHTAGSWRRVPVCRVFLPAWRHPCSRSSDSDLPQLPRNEGGLVLKQLTIFKCHGARQSQKFFRANMEGTIVQQKLKKPSSIREPEPVCYGKGGVPWLEELSPQQATVPSILMPQVCISPAATCVKNPTAGVLWPHVSFPQQATVPSVFTPQV